MITGSGVGILAFASPILAQAIFPPFIIISGFAPKKAGFHKTRSASFFSCIAAHFSIWVKQKKTLRLSGYMALVIPNPLALSIQNVGSRFGIYWPIKIQTCSRKGKLYSKIWDVCVENYDTSTEPIKSANPFAIAGFIVYFAMYLFILALSSPAVLGPITPLWAFILSAVCHVLLITCTEKHTHSYLVQRVKAYKRLNSSPIMNFWIKFGSFQLNRISSIDFIKNVLWF